MTSEYNDMDVVALTVQQRFEIYQKMTPEQQEVLDDYRKHLLRSTFLQNSYIEASDWRFDDLKIDSTYPEKSENELYCKCGRRLKYQYILVSRTTGESIGLGRQHFQDHLKVPSQVVSEINQEINQVDLGLDELLIEFEEGLRFPYDYWEIYQQVLFENHMSERPKEVDLDFVKKLVAFATADMPLYKDDFKLLSKKIMDHPVDSDLTEWPYDLAQYEVFKKELIRQVDKTVLFEQAAIWSTRMRQQMERNNYEIDIPTIFFETLYQLIKENHTNRQELKKGLEDFSKTGMGRWIQRRAYQHLFTQIMAYGLTESLFFHIHPVFREGLLPYFDADNHKSKVDEAIQGIENLFKNMEEADILAVLDHFQIKETPEK